MIKKIKFDIKYRPEIELGKYQTVTENGRQVRIVCWDWDTDFPILGKIADSPSPDRWDINGNPMNAAMQGVLDLYVLTDEPKFVKGNVIKYRGDIYEITDITDVGYFVRILSGTELKTGLGFALEDEMELWEECVTPIESKIIKLLENRTNDYEINNISIPKLAEEFIELARQELINQGYIVDKPDTEQLYKIDDNSTEDNKPIGRLKWEHASREMHVIKRCLISDPFVGIYVGNYIPKGVKYIPLDDIENNII